MGSAVYVKNDVISILTFTFIFLTLAQPIAAQTNIFPFCVTSCVGRTTGQYANCATCRLFVYCVNGRLFNSPCQGLLFYDAVKGICDYPSRAVCRTGTPPTTTQATTSQSSESSISSDSSGSSDSSPSSSFSLSSETSFSSETSYFSNSSALSEASQSSESSNTSPESPLSMTSDVTSYIDIYCVTSCTSTAPGVYASCDNCADYFLCSRSNPQMKSCGALNFNPDTEQCDAPANVECATTSARSMTSAQSEQTELSDRSMSSESSSSSLASETSDSSLTSLSSDSSESSQSSEASFSSEASESSPQPECLEACGGQPDGDYPYCFGCSKYLRCLSGSTELKDCGSTLVFNSTISGCALESTCMFTSPQSGISRTSMTSQTSLNSELSETSGTSGSSLTSESIICTLTCAGIPAGDWPSCDDCQDYFRCDGSDGGGRESCAPSLGFSHETLQCALLSEFNCTVTSPTSITSESSLASLLSERSEISHTSEASETSQTSGSSGTSEKIFCVDSCTNAPFGDWPACDDCQYFYRCSFTDERRSCHSTLLFNPDTNQCDQAENVICATTSPSSESSASSDASELSEVSLQSETSETSLVSETSDSSASSGISLTSMSSSSSEASMVSDMSDSSATSESIFCLTSCGDVVMGDYPSCDDCGSFYRCGSASSSGLRSCGGSLLFNPVSGQCDINSNVICSTTSLSSQSSESSPMSGSSEAIFCLTGDCGNFPSGLYPDCDDCMFYHNCPGDGTPGTRQSCTTVGILFDPVNLQCNLAANVMCATTSASSGTSATSFSSEISRTPSMTSEEPGTSGSSGSSITSISSMTSQASNQSDTSETSVSSMTSEAIGCLTFTPTVCSDYNLASQDFSECSSCEAFVRCGANQESESKSCFSGLRFNSVLGSCDLSSNVLNCATTSLTSGTSQISLASVTSGSSETSQQSDQSDQSVTSGSSGSSEAIFCLASCSTAPLGDWADCDNCKDFHRCDGIGNGTLETCSSILYFNPAINDCDLIENIICATTSASSATSEMSEISDSPTSEPSDRSDLSVTSGSSLTSEGIFCTTTCDNLPFGRFADCNDCTQFYECGTTNTVKSCGTLSFNPDNGSCDLAANVVCA